MTLCSWDRNRTKMAKSIAVSLALNTIATSSLNAWIFPLSWKLHLKFDLAYWTGGGCQPQRRFSYYVWCSAIFLPPRRALSGEWHSKGKFGILSRYICKDFSNSNKFSHGIKKAFMDVWQYRSCGILVFSHFPRPFQTALIRRIVREWRRSRMVAFPDAAIDILSAWHLVHVF